MASMFPVSSSRSPQAAAQPGLMFEIRQFWQLFFVAAFDPYRPEQHYMRGPGPACAAKTTSAADGAPAAPSH